MGAVAGCKTVCCASPAEGKAESILTSGAKPTFSDKEEAAAPVRAAVSSTKSAGNCRGNAAKKPARVRVSSVPCSNSLKIFRAAMKKSFPHPTEAFDKLDKDGSHEVTMDEWLNVLQELGDSVPWDAQTIDVMSRFGVAFFDQMDLDGGGTLAFAEFKKGLVHKLHPNENRGKSIAKFRAALNKKFQHPKDAFDILDKQGSGTVTREEWMACIGDLARAVKWDKGTLDFGEALFDEMDVDRSGEVNADEFKERLTSQLDVKSDDNSLAVFRAMMKRSFKNPQDAFDLLTQNSDRVTEEEWMDLLEEFGLALKWDAREMMMIGQFGKAFFEQMDVNGDGEIEVAEFKRCLVKKLEPPKNYSNLSKFKAAMNKSFKNPKDAFDMLDRNGNSRVSKDEWCDCLCEVGRAANWDEDTLEMCSSFGTTLFDQLDADGSGELNLEEFMTNLTTKLDAAIPENAIAIFKSAMKRSYKNPKNAFDELDKFGNKTISKEEWMNCLEHVGLSAKWDAETVALCTKFGDKFFDYMDSNGDGKLVFSEFKASLGKKLET